MGGCGASAGGGGKGMDEQKWTETQEALRKGDKAKAKEIIESGYDMNGLYPSGADPMLQSTFLCTAVGFAKLGSNQHEFVKELIQMKVDVNKANGGGQGPLHLAAKAGNTEMAKLLIDNNADIHQTDDIGNTPLFIALMGNSTEQPH